MLEFLVELVFEFFGELILQLIAEAFGGLFKAGWYKARSPKRDLSPVGEAGWSVATGLAAGALTLLVVPQLAIRVQWLQVLNLVLAPVAAGLAWSGCAPGANRARRSARLCSPTPRCSAWHSR